MAKVSLKGASVGNKGGRYLPAGKHLIKVEQVKVVDSFKNGPMFVVEMEVLESDEAKTGTGWSWVRPFEDKFGYGQNDIKEWLFLWAGSMVEDFDEDSVTDDEVDQLLEVLTGPDQPAKDTLWRAEGYEKATKNGQTITIITWKPETE